jgi:hypothetical protein
MFIHVAFGTKRYGRVDVVPGLLHVETEFFHLWYLPLVPLRSWIVLPHQRDAWSGVPIPLSFRSVAIAWFRGCCFLLGFAALILASIRWDEWINNKRGPDLLVATVIGSIVVVAVYFVPALFRAADPERAAELARLAGYSADVVARLRSGQDPSVGV